MRQVALAMTIPYSVIARLDEVKAWQSKNIVIARKFCVAKFSWQSILILWIASAFVTPCKDEVVGVGLLRAKPSQ